MTGPAFATKSDLAAMATADDDWVNAFDASNTPALGDDWEQHPFWANQDALADPTTAAGKAIADMQSECTPLERAEAAKVRPGGARAARRGPAIERRAQEAGNRSLKQGVTIHKKLMIREAVKQYGEGLAFLEAAGDVEGAAATRCALHSNRAHASGLLGNWRNALNDALAALKANPAHIKSHIRAANAARQLRSWREAVTLCERGLEAEPGAPELLKTSKVEGVRRQGFGLEG